jgi:DNA polymerase-3 subunit epsilon
LPAVTGVYYIYNESGTLIYIGKSINIRKRLNQHFTGITNSAKRFKLKYLLSYEETGSELVALKKVKKSRKKPKYNRAQRKSIFQWALYPKWMRRLFELKIIKGRT